MSMTNKALFGEVATDSSLVEKMLDLIPREKYANPHLRWLDPACGGGNFMRPLRNRLFHSLAPIIPNPIERSQHIHEKMLFMVEINEDHIPNLRHAFPNANIYCQDFLSYTPTTSFDIIIGNPPFNSGGLKKVPTNTQRSKKTDGKTIWTLFVKHALSLLREDGLLSMFTPSLWMKPDKAGIYKLLSGHLEKIRCFTNTQTNKLFHGNAQTPTCFFLAKKDRPDNNIVNLYEPTLQRYIPYPLLSNMPPLPVYGASVFAKLQPFLMKVGAPHIIKTGMPPKNTCLSPERTTAAHYTNIRSCILSNNQPTLTHEYSETPLAFFGQPKLVLAHKMYGFPYYDAAGKYGISRRDNYVMINQSREDFEKWHAFLSTRFALYLMEGTRYRMKYLEKYVFQMIPDILQLDDFPDTINDNTIADYFQLTEIERKSIAALHKKTYGRFPFEA